jgi:hypothetical protein
MSLLDEYREKMKAVAEGKANPYGSGEILCDNRQFKSTSRAAKNLAEALEKGQKHGGKAALPDWRSLPPLP